MQANHLIWHIHICHSIFLKLSHSLQSSSHLHTSFLDFCQPLFLGFHLSFSLSSTIFLLSRS